MQAVLRRFTNSLPSFDLNDKISAAAAGFAVLVMLSTLGALSALREQRLFYDRLEALAAASRNIERGQCDDLRRRHGVARHLHVGRSQRGAALR
ncbi:hypothetical protein ACVIJ6_002661 [Bradyrhizobium sp. USDA 4369]